MALCLGRLDMLRQLRGAHEVAECRERPGPPAHIPVLQDVLGLRERAFDPIFPALRVFILGHRQRLFLGSCGHCGGYRCAARRHRVRPGGVAGDDHCDVNALGLPGPTRRSCSQLVRHSSLPLVLGHGDCRYDVLLQHETADAGGRQQRFDTTVRQVAFTWGLVCQGGAFVAHVEVRGLLRRARREKAHQDQDTEVFERRPF
mmetsp:Transcript_118300/g.334300  ORF Transcript_118300/g.334300 Transcript_118300/m.334300 type:complete len:202 (-) Transcript_118300:572-1177(-)